MANIKVNDDKSYLGKISILRAANFDVNPVQLMIQGQLSTHRYFEEINSLETARYRIEGISVYQESFGSEDFNILYSFTADKLIVKGGETNLTDVEIDVKEDELYDYDGGAKDGSDQ